MRIIKNDFIIEDVTLEEAAYLLGTGSAPKKNGRRKGPKDNYSLPKGVGMPKGSKMEKTGKVVIPYEEKEILYIYKRMNETPAPRINDVYAEGIQSGSIMAHRPISSVHNMRAFLKKKDKSKMTEKVWNIVQDLELKKQEKADGLLSNIMN